MKIIFCYDNLLAVILKMVNLTMSGRINQREDSAFWNLRKISHKNDAVS